MGCRLKGITSRSKLLQFSSRKSNKQLQSTVTMNKWSLLLFSVLGLLLSSTSEPNFVDGRLGGCYRSSRSLLSGTRISISQPHCTYHSFNEIRHLTSPKQDIRYATKNVELRRSLRSDGRPEQFENQQISSDKRLNSLSNVVFDLEDSNVFNIRNKRTSRKTCSRDNFRLDHVYRSRSRNQKMGDSTREREIDIGGEMSEIRDNRLRGYDRSVSVHLKGLKQERFTRLTSVVRSNTMENIDKSLHVVQNNEGKRDMRRNNLDVNTRKRFFSDSRFSFGLVRNSDSRFKRDNRGSNGRLLVRFVKQPISISEVPEIDILRNVFSFLQDYRRLSVRDDSNERIYERKSSSDVLRNFDMNDNVPTYRRCYDKDISKEVLERNCNKNMGVRVQNKRITRLDKGSKPRIVKRESHESDNKIRNNERLINGYENRLLEKRYSIRRLPKHISDMNTIEKARHARFYNDINFEEVSRSLLIEGTEHFSDRETREIRLIEQFTDDRISPTRNGLREKQTGSSNINNRRSDAFRRTVLERRERGSRYVTQIRNDDNFSDELLVRENPHRKLERLIRTEKRAYQVIQRENQKIMHIGAMNIPENRIYKDFNFNRRIGSNNNENFEKRQARTYNEKFNREEFRNLMVRETERVIDENRISQARDNHNYRHEYRLNAERTAERDLTHIDRNRNNVVERDLVSISSIGNNRSYGLIQRTLTVLKRSENFGFKYWTVHEKQGISDQRRIRNLLERREVDLSNERLGHRDFVGRNNMKNAMLNQNRRNFKDESNSQAFRIETERSVSVNKPSSYLRMTQREHENRILMNNPYSLRKERYSTRRLARQHSDTNRIVADRRARTLNEKLYTRHEFRTILPAEAEQFFDESRIRQVLDSRDYRFNEKRNAEWLPVRNIHKIIENRASKIRPEFVVNRQNQNTKLAPISLHLFDKDMLSLVRLNERDSKQNRDGTVKNSREFTRIKDQNRNNRIAEIRDLKHANGRNTRNKVTTRYIENNIEFYDSDKTDHERKTERVIRNIARYAMDRTIRRIRIIQRISLNKRHLQEVSSENLQDVYRELEFVRDVRRYKGLENRAHCENRDNDRKSDRNNNRGREAQDWQRDIRGSNGLQIFKRNTRLTTKRNEEEREIRTVFSKIRHFPIENKTESYIEVFKIKWQHMFYLLQGLYILVLTKFTYDANGNQKRIGFSNWFPLFSTLKVD